MDMYSISLLFLLVVQSSSPLDTQAPRSAAEETQAILEEVKNGDLATSLNASIDSKEIELSPKMYRAIQAVEQYRARAQKRQLSRKEQDLENFNITVTLDDRGSWLKVADRTCCYLVVLSPRFLPGEKVATDTHARIGRVALYAVDKVNHTVVQTRLGER
jgi:hypothetical protein